jgi:hypothetical protein
MPDLALLWLPLAGLALATLAGAGLVSALAPGLPADARAALAPLAGVAALAAASTLLPLGASSKAVALTVLGAGLVATLALRSAWASLRAGVVPLALAVAAVALAGAPALARGDWQPTSLYGSTDAYHWVSQGRAYLEEPAPKPVEEHPDRLTYERSHDQHWAVAVPFGVGQLAWLQGSDAVEAYGALAALLFALLPLASYAAARACLGWRPALAAAAGAAVTLNASLLFASHFSWQQQVAGSALAFAAAAVLRLGLAPDAPRRTLGLAALLAAGALGTYRLGFFPFLALLLAAVVGAYAWRSDDRRAVLRRGAGFLGAAGLLALPSLVALVRGVPEFVGSGGFSTAFKEAFPIGQPAEALGLVPRVWALEEGWGGALRIGWLLAASVLAAALFWLGIRAARRALRADFLLAGAALVLGGYLVLLLPVFAPYLSYKLLSYGAPFLVLLALSPLAHRRGRTEVAVTALAAAFLAASGAVATVAADRSARPPDLVAAGAVPRDAVVLISTDDPWRQAWQLYALRDVRVSVEWPTYLLTAQGRGRPAAGYRRSATHEVVETAVRPVR